MKDTTENFQVLKLRTKTNRDTQPTWYYIKKYANSEDRHAYTGKFSLTADLDCATDFSDQSMDQYIDYYNFVVNVLKEDDEVEVATVTRKIKHDKTPFDSTMILERRRRTALTKLTHAEQEALGVTPYAVYDKLKNHNAD